jgi:hypothetical protein
MLGHANKLVAFWSGKSALNFPRLEIQGTVSKSTARIPVILTLQALTKTMPISRHSCYTEKQKPVRFDQMKSLLTF